MSRKPRKTESIGRILDAARNEFAEHGFSGARVDAIADRAGVNKALLYYHVGGKAALYERVLHQTIGILAESLEAIIKPVADPVEKLKIYARSLAETVCGNPQIPSIVTQELTCGARHLPEQTVRDFARMFNLITEIIEEGVRKGVFRDTAPVLIHFMVMGAAIFHPRVSELSDRYDNLAEPQRLEKNFYISLEEEIEQLILNAVCI
jgi:AcrR family transcriptional regulator